VIVDRIVVERVNWPVGFWKVPIILTFWIMCAGFLPGQTQPGSETGIEGIITISPTKPGPVPIGAPSSQPLANATFAVENDTGAVASFTTDGQGRFRAPLAPGHYKVSLKGKTTGVGRFGPFEVDVVAGKMTKVEWRCDSGIR
jgi:hypothetical protein